MRHFLLKKPTNLSLIQEEYETDAPVPNCNQVRFAGDRSNSKLVRCSSGEWFIRTGNTMLRLKDVPTKEAALVRLCGDGGEFVGKVDCKWFLEKR